MTQSIDQFTFTYIKCRTSHSQCRLELEKRKQPFYPTLLYNGRNCPNNISRWNAGTKPHHLYLVPSFTTHSYQCNSHFTHYYLHIYEDHQSESGILEDWNFPIEIPAGNLELPLIKRLCEINPTMQLLNPTRQAMTTTPH